MRALQLLFLLPLLTIIGCGTDPIQNPFPDDTQAYYPLYVGHEITYQIDSIRFDDAPGGNQMDTVQFQLREAIVSVQADEAGDSIFVLHRLRRNAESDPWQITDVWTTRKTTAEAFRTEENLIFTKLSFPLRFGKRWMSTAYIFPFTQVLIGTEVIRPYQAWEAEVLSFDRAADVGSFSFPEGQAMVLHQTDTDDGLMRRYVRETYVRNIGLVARYDEILDSRCIELGDFGPCIGKLWIEHASKGYILKQEMIAWQ